MLIKITTKILIKAMNIFITCVILITVIVFNKMNLNKKIKVG